MFKNNWTIYDVLLLSSLFHIFYFIFGAPFSFCLWFPVYPSLVAVLSKFMKHSRKAFIYIYINSMYNIF